MRDVRICRQPPFPGLHATCRSTSEGVFKGPRPGLVAKPFARPNNQVFCDPAEQAAVILWQPMRLEKDCHKVFTQAGAMDRR